MCICLALAAVSGLDFVFSNSPNTYPKTIDIIATCTPFQLKNMYAFEAVTAAAAT